MTRAAGRRPADLKEACLAEALDIIDQDGVEKLSMREVSRRLGISHQAPYKHFHSREHILTEVVARAFDGFATFLETRCTAPEPADRLKQMAHAYLDYAKAHPLQYRLMFMTTLPEPSTLPAPSVSADLPGRSQRGFAMLLDTLRAAATARGAERTTDGVYGDAVFILATLHGIASLTSTATLDTLSIPSTVHERLMDDLLRRIGEGIGKLDHTP